MDLAPSRFAIGDEAFLLDGCPHRIVSGMLHYFRHHPDDWRDRLRKARLMGLNAVETYVPWNAHERMRGSWDFSGGLDLGRFLDLAGEEGLHAIVRPGPFICAEWANGGLPVWLTADPQTRLRSSDPRYLLEAERFSKRVYEEIAPRQIDRGGNVLLVQVENEYGSYGTDREYLEGLVALAREAGITVPLITVDTAERDAIELGSVPGALATLSFGSRPEERLSLLRELHPGAPLMVTEFWIAWFDAWGGHHHVTSPEQAAADLDTMLAMGASVNLFPFSGGTNFGLWNGANDLGRYAPVVTSYDYDAPLDELGEPTAKYFAFRDVIAKHLPVSGRAPRRTAPPPVLTVPLESSGDWLLRHPRDETVHPEPPTFEQLGTDAALVLYATTVGAPGRFEAHEIRDAVWFSLNDEPIGRALRALGEHGITVPGTGRLEVLVEDQGRIHYGPRIGEPKGLIGPVSVVGAATSGWTATVIDVEAIAADMATAPADPWDVVHTGTIGMRADVELAEPAALLIDTAGWGKGYAFVNGFFLGRYWQAGPQRTLVVPRGATRSGRNRIVIVELEGVRDPTLRLVDRLQLGHLAQ